ncbi:MAG: 3D-(3,5/4)-trihydroxycyclohexane-1,2-dione acylhydrolase (decyclizing) [Planctomycetales bacterium]
MPASPHSRTERVTMAQAVVKYLQAQYSERDGNRRRLIPAIFGIFGHGNVCGLGQALEEYGEKLPYYQPCNEQSMVHTAIGYAKANNRLATLACTASIGPGSTNMITGAATATTNHLPVLLFPSDYYVTRHQGPVLQQLEHPVSADLSVNDCFRPVSRFFDRISRPEQLLTALPEAMRVLLDPVETGAVTIALPQDLQAHAYDYPAHFFNERMWRVERRLPDPQRIRETVSLLLEAKRPAIIAGGGVHYSEAWEELQQFAESFGIPVGETFAGKGAMRNASAMAMGGHGLEGTGTAATIIGQADLVISIGTRLTDFTTGSQSCFHNPEVKFVNINVCGHDAYKQGALPIVADAREALRVLTSALRETKLAPKPEYLREIEAARQKWSGVLKEAIQDRMPAEAMSQGEMILTINGEAKAGDTIVAAAGGPPGDLLKLWDVTGNRKCHLEFGFSCMGYEIPAGLGVRLAQPDGEVIVLIGDGTYLMNPTELMTSLQEKLKLTVVISENHGYQCIRRLQMWRTGVSFGNEFRQRDSGTNRLEGEYVPIDLCKNAESFGARTWYVRTKEELRRALAEARQETRTSVIVVETEKHRFLPGGGVWWDVAPAEVCTDETTRQLRADYESDKKRLQKYHY